jgi:transposase
VYKTIRINNRKYKVYKVDTVLKEHALFCLPPCHPELNPIELILGLVKDWDGSQCGPFNLEDVQNWIKTEGIF